MNDRLFDATGPATAKFGTEKSLTPPPQLIPPCQGTVVVGTLKQLARAALKNPWRFCFRRRSLRLDYSKIELSAAEMTLEATVQKLLGRRLRLIFGV